MEKGCQDSRKGKRVVVVVEQKLVSVVLSVFDKPADVSRTIKSVLTQKNVELELIIVIDGQCFNRAFPGGFCISIFLEFSNSL